MKSAILIYCITILASSLRGQGLVLSGSVQSAKDHSPLIGANVYLQSNNQQGIIVDQYGQLSF